MTSIRPDDPLSATDVLALGHQLLAVLDGLQRALDVLIAYDRAVLHRLAVEGGVLDPSVELDFNEERVP